MELKTKMDTNGYKYIYASESSSDKLGSSNYIRINELNHRPSDSTMLEYEGKS